MHATAPTLATPSIPAIREILPRWSKLVIVSIFITLLMPRGVEVQLGSIMINPSRILLSIFGVAAMTRVLSNTIKIRWSPADTLMFIHVGAIAASALYHDGFGEGLENAIAFSVDMGLAYFVARCAICNMTCYRYYIRIALIIAAISGAFGLIECLTGFSPVRAFFKIVFSEVGYVYLHNQRLGLYRATATFRADILLGLYCATVFTLAYYIPAAWLGLTRIQRKWYLFLALCGVFTSLSSGPWLATSLALFCFVYDHIMRGDRNRWKLLITAIVIAWMVVSVIANRGPFTLVIDYLSLNSLSGHVRLAMYEAVWAMVPDHWPMGWGWGPDWPRPDWYVWQSIDCFYAVQFVRSGIFAVLSILVFFIYSWITIGKKVARNPAITMEVKGWILATVCMSVAIITVHIFGNLIYATYFMWGAGQVLMKPNPSTRHRKTYVTNS